jgi:hypothetical protein
MLDEVPSLALALYITGAMARGSHGMGQGY